jgi:hypothetical protein
MSALQNANLDVDRPYQHSAEQQVHGDSAEIERIRRVNSPNFSFKQHWNAARIDLARPTSADPFLQIGLSTFVKTRVRDDQPGRLVINRRVGKVPVRTALRPACLAS